MAHGERVICKSETLAEGGLGVRFPVGEHTNGFVIRFLGAVRGYVNRCPHVGTPLDLWPNEFFTDDGCALICSTHGAVFEPISGRCTAGPCVGDRLTPLPLDLEGETLVVRLPAATTGPQ